MLCMVGITNATIRYAATGSTADVQTAINAAVAGDTVSIPAGINTWTTNIVCNVPLIIQGTNN